MGALACFVSSHGFGHATRAAAVLAALRAGRPELRLEVFTEVPEAVIGPSVPGGVRQHKTWTDVGLVQEGPFREDLAATVRVLGEHVPFRAPLVQGLAAQLQALGAQAVLCDVSPLGLAVARAAGLPSVLVENFTWDWIYRGYLDREPRLGPFADELERHFASATLHLQPLPVCVPSGSALQLPPISRAPRLPREVVREQLGLGERERLVLVTMGGVPWTSGSREGLLRGLPGDVRLLLTGGAPGSGQQRSGPLHQVAVADFFHPDLVNAADAVIGKVGYSTLAEVHRAGVPFGYLVRPGFRESEVLGRFVATAMPGLPLVEEQLFDGSLGPLLAQLLALQRVDRAPHQVDGAEQAARLLGRFL